MSDERRKWLVALSVMLPTLIEIVDTSIVNVSLDHIRGSLSASIDESTWAITSYLVSNAIIIPMTGWFSSLFGRKRYLIGSIILFTVSSLLCGLAWSLPSLVFFRVLQGIGGGALQPLSQSILLETFPRQQHGMAMAIFGIGIMFGPIIGPLLGGWITDSWSWHWIFFINIPIGILSVIMVVFFIHDPDYIKKEGIKIDYMGIALLTVGLGALQIVLDKGQMEDWFASDFIVTLSILSAACLTLFVFVERIVEHPIVNLKTLKNVSFTAGCVVMFFAFFNLFGSIVLLPIFLQKAMGYTSFLAGLVLGPGGLATLLMMPIVGKLINRINPKFILFFGLSVAAYSTHMMAQLTLDSDFATVFMPRVVLGIGMSCLFIPLTTLTMSSIPREEMGNATGIYNLLRNLGGSFGVAFVTTMLVRGAQRHQNRLVENLTPYDLPYQEATERAGAYLQYRGLDAGAAEQGAMGSLYQELIRQASLLSFNEAFHMLSTLMMMTLPLILLLRHHKQAGPPGPKVMDH